MKLKYLETKTTPLEMPFNSKYLYEIIEENKQYKQQIDELKKEIDRIWSLDDVDFYYERLNRMTFKLKERNEE